MIFPGDFFSVRTGMRTVLPVRQVFSCLEDNEHDELYWLHRSNYAASEPAGQPGRAGLRASPLLPCPHHLLRAAYLALSPLRLPGPIALLLLLPRWLWWTSSSHMKHLAMLTASGRTAYGYRCPLFGVSEQEGLAGLGKHLVGASVKKAFLQVIALDTIPCAISHACDTANHLKEGEARNGPLFVWWWK